MSSRLAQRNSNAKYNETNHYYSASPSRYRTVTRRDSYYDDDDVEVRIAPRRNSLSFLRQDSIRNDRAVVIRERSRRHTRSKSPTANPHEHIRTRVVERGASSYPSPPPIARIGKEIVVERERDRSVSPIRDHASMKDVQAVWNPSSTGDTTVHLELDIEEDIEGQLEEFSRLRRLGRFKDADQHFQSYLRDYIDLPPVAVEYAGMLLGQGAYKHLKEQLLKQELSPPRGPDPSSDLPHITTAGGARIATYHTGRVDADTGNHRSRSQDRRPLEVVQVGAPETGANTERFDLGFRLIETWADLVSQGCFGRAVGEARYAEEELFQRTKERRRERLHLDSTEVQIICSWLDIMTYLGEESNLVQDDEIYDVWSDWPGLYQCLLAEDRIWEFRDVIIASVYAFGVEEAWQMFFHTDLYSSDSLTKILDDWHVEEYDEATYLALLSILTTLGDSLASRHMLPSDRGTIAASKRCLEQARAFANCIKENNPENIKSRPYIRWILAQEELARYLGYFVNGTLSNKPTLSSHYMKGFPGLTFFMGPLPIYVPVKLENPGWPVSSAPPQSNELLETALKVSQELGDYSTEVMCLQELICRSQDPKDLFDQLSHLQKSVQGDMVGYLETCLSKYLFATTDELRQALSDELAALDVSRRPISNDIRSPLLEWCQRMVQSALSRSLGRDPVETEHTQEMAKQVAVDLPDDILLSISDLSFYNQRETVVERIVVEERREPHRTSSPGGERTIQHRRTGSPYDERIIEIETEHRPKSDVVSRRTGPRTVFDRQRNFLDNDRYRRRGTQLTEPHRREFIVVDGDVVETHRRDIGNQDQLNAREEEEKRIKLEFELRMLKEKKAKEIEHRRRMEEELRKSGMSEKYVNEVLKTANVPDVPGTVRPTYTRLSRRHLSLETLNKRHVDYEIDKDEPDYIIIKRWVPEHEQDSLWLDTKLLRERRQKAHATVLAIEDKKPDKTNVVTNEEGDGNVSNLDAAKLEDVHITKYPVARPAETGLVDDRSVFTSKNISSSPVAQAEPRDEEPKVQELNTEGKNDDVDSSEKIDVQPPVEEVDPGAGTLRRSKHERSDALAKEPPVRGELLETYSDEESR